MRRVLKRLQTPLPHETGFNASDNPYTESEFLKICEDYRVPNDPMKYLDKKFYWTYQPGVHWPDDYIGPDSLTQWIIEKLVSFTDVRLYKILESVRAYAYLILSSQASARSSIVGNTATPLTAQSTFLNNFENVVNQRVDIREDIKRYQDTLTINWLLRFWIQNLTRLLMFDELVITILETSGFQNLMRLLMFDELVITISSELKSGFQFSHASIINEVLNLINL